MSKIIPIALGGGIASVLAAWWLGRKREEETEPAAPIAAPAPTGDSGIAITPNEIEALARIIASEAASGTLAEQRAIAWTARNRFRGKSIYAVESPWRAQKGANPPFSSARPATDAHRMLAREVLEADQSADPTGGATAFFEPRMQDIFATAGEMARRGETGDRVIGDQKLTDITRFKSYKKDAAAIRTKWSKGSTLYATAGRFEFWGNARLFARRGGTVQTVVGFAGSLPRRIEEGFTASDQEALSRMLASFRGSEEEQQAVAWVTRNRAARLGLSIWESLAPEGQYGSLGSGGRSFASTECPETPWSRALAAAVLSQRAEDDPTGGAIDFWKPALQDKLKVLGDLYRATGDARLRGYAGYTAGKAGAREGLRARGLRAVGIIGGIELLG